MNEWVYDILESISICIALVPLLILLRTNGVSSHLKRLLIILLVLELASELTTKILSVFHVNGFLIIHIYTLLYGLILLLISRTKIKSVFAKRIVLYCYVVLLFVEFWELNRVEGYLLVNTYSYLVLNVIGIAISVSIFFQLINDRQLNDMKIDFFFWFSTALIFFFGTTIAITLFQTYILMDNPDIIYYIWPIQLIANIIYHLILARGIWQMRQISY